MLVLDGKPLRYDKGFVHNGVQYPPNWLRCVSWEEKAAIGIEEVPDPPAWDQRFAWGYLEDGSLNYKDHEQLKETWTSQVKQTAASLLAPTDWYIIRRADSGDAIPQEVLDARAEIREYSNKKEVAIGATQDSAELAAYVTSPMFNVWSFEQELAVNPPVETDLFSGEDTIQFTGGATSSGVTTDSVFL